jgi:hypothetical protein
MYKIYETTSQDGQDRAVLLRRTWRDRDPGRIKSEDAVSQRVIWLRLVFLQMVIQTFGDLVVGLFLRICYRIDHETTQVSRPPQKDRIFDATRQRAQRSIEASRAEMTSRASVAMRLTISPAGSFSRTRLTDMPA